MQKDCLISYAGNQYSVPAEYVGKDVAVAALDSMLAAYYEGRQIALHRISYQRKDVEKQGRKIVMAGIVQDIDAAIGESLTFDSFLAALRRQRYTIKCGSNVKHTTVQPPGGDYVFRLDSPGAGYTEAHIRERLAAARRGESYGLPLPPSAPPIPLIRPIPQVKKAIPSEGVLFPVSHTKRWVAFVRSI